MNKKLLALVCCMLLISACAPTWTLVNEKNNHLQLDQVSFTMPIDWVLYNNHYNSYTALINGSRVDQEVKRVVATRNGLNLDIIDILQFNANNAFPSVGKAVNNSTLPSELAELLIAEQKITLGIDYAQVVKSEPVMIVGRKGFVVQFRMKNKSGLQIDQLVYGFVSSEYFYTFKFRAASLHYFQESLPDFENLIESLRLST